MSENKSRFRAAIAVVAACAVVLLGQPALAAPVYKANNADALSLATSWIDGVVPGAEDVATWDGTVTGANATALGANLNWAGIAVFSPGGTVTINAGNTLTLGSAGIDLSAATQNLTLNSPVALNGAQTWNVASGRTLAVGGIVSAAGSTVTKAGAGALTLTGANTFNGGLTLSNGAVNNNVYGALGTGTFTFGDANTGWNNVTLFHNAGNSSATNIVVSAEGTGLAILKWSTDWWGTTGKTYNTAGDWTLTLNRMINFQCTGGQIAPYVTGNGVAAGDIAVKVDGGTQVTWTAQMNAANNAVRANDFTGNVWITGNTKLQTQNRSYQINSAAYHNGVIPDQATVIIDAGSTWQLHHGAETVGFLSGGGTVSVGTGTAGNGLTLAGDAATPAADVFNVGSATFTGTLATVENGLIKTGTGTQELSGANIRYATNTTLRQGTLVLTNTTAWASPIALDPANALALQLNAPATANAWTLGKVISGGSANATVRKTGDGTVTLSQVNTYTGATVINGGKLNITGSLAAASPVTVNAGGTLAGSGTINSLTTLADSTSAGIEGSPGGAGTLTLNAATFQGSGFLTANVASPGGAFTPITITNALTAAGPNTIAINLLNTSIPSSGVYHLAKYGSLAGYTNPDAFKLGTFVAGNTRYYSLQHDTVNNYVNLSVDTSVRPIWTGALNSEWSTATMADPKNWKLSSSGVGTDFLTGDGVEFPDDPANNVVEISVEDVSPGGVTFNNSTATEYSLQGWFGIAGSGPLTKTNTGTLTIGNVNSFTGPVNFNGGTIVASTLSNAGTPSALGAGNSLTFDGGTLRYNGGSITANRTLALNAGGGTIQVDDAWTTLRIAAAVSGTGTLTKAGPGILGLDTAGGAIAFNSVLAGSEGALALYGTNDLVLGGTEPNTFSGETLVYGRHIFLNKPAGVNAIAGNLTIKQGNWPYHGITINQNEQIADSAVLTFDFLTMTDAYDFRLNGRTETLAGIVTTGTVSDSRAIIENAGYDGGNDTGITNNGTLIVSGPDTYAYRGQLRDRNGGSSGVTNFVKSGTGTQVFIGGGITYTGTTKILGGVLRLDLSTALPGNNIEINGGVLELKSPAALTRTLDAGSGQIQLTGGASGFSAFDAPVTIKLNNDAATEVQWGSATFNPAVLVLNAATATGNIEFQNKIDLNGATRAVNVGAGTATISGVLRDGAGAGGLTKGGPGTLVLTAPGEYTGPTSVNAGKLYVNHSLTAASAVQVAGGATLGGQGNVGATTVAEGGAIEGGMAGNGTLTLHTLAFSGAGTVNLTPSAGDYVPVTVAAGDGLTAGGGPGSVAVNIGGVVPVTGTYHLIQYAGAIQGGFDRFALGTTPLGARTVYTLVNNPGYIDLDVATDSLVWTGAFSSEWSDSTLASPKNWKLGGNNAPTDFLAGDVVLFDNTADNTIVDVGAGEVSPSSVTFDNDAAHEYTLQSSAFLSAAITGPAALIKRGEGTLNIETPNAHTGGTTFTGGLNAGTVSFVENGLGTEGGITLASSATLRWNGHGQDLSSRLVLGDNATATIDTMWNNVAFAAGLGASGGSLVKTGMGMLTLAGANAYTGQTTISQGTLKLDNNNALPLANAIVLGDADTADGDVELNYGAAINANDFVAGGGVVTKNVSPVTVNGQGAGTATISVSSPVTIRAIVTMNRATTLRATSALNDFAGLFTGPGAGEGNDTLIIDNPSGSTMRTTVYESSAGVGVAADFTGNVRVKSGRWQMQNISYQANDAAHQNLAIPDTSNVTVDFGAEWIITHGSETIDGLSGMGRVAYHGATAFVTPHLVVGGGNSTTGSFSGSFADHNGTLTAPFTLKKIGAGAQELVGMGIAYSGETTLSQGTLKLTNTSAWNSPIVLDGANQVVLQLNAAEVWDAWTAATPISGGSAGAAIEKIGEGTITLSGANAYVGANRITVGTLQLGSAAALGDAANSLTVEGTLDLNGLTATVGELSGTAGTITSNAGTATAVLTSNFDVGTATYEGTMIDGSDAVGLVKAGSGTLALSGENAYSAGTTVNDGTLRIDAAGALPAGGALTIGAAGTVVLGAGLSAAGAAASSQAVAAVPEPGTLALLAAGLAALLAGLWRRRK